MWRGEASAMARLSGVRGPICVLSFAACLLPEPLPKY